MTSIFGLGLAAVLAAGLAWTFVHVWAHPFRGLGVLAAGMALHNFVLMLLLRLHTPHLVIRAVQAWKEILLALLILVIARAIRTGRTWPPRPALNFFDWAVLAFAVVVVIYFLLPAGLFDNGTTLTQRVLGLRLLLTLPVLYAIGRLVAPGPGDLAWTVRLIGGSGVAVAIFGLVELWFVPTATWVSAGANLVSGWLGHTYAGPGGLPENYVQTTPEGLLIRRLVSTYLSPLAVAYSGLLIVPLLAARERRGPPSRWAVAGLVLVIASIGFSVTRAAIVLLLGEMVLMAILWRRPLSLVAVPLTAVFAGLVLFGYVHVAPAVDRDLRPVRQPAGYALLVRVTGLDLGSGGDASGRNGSDTGTGQTSGIVSRGDPSLREHLTLISTDYDFLLAHPLGAGIGASVNRFGSARIGESAVFSVFGETGLLGGILYLLMYALLLVAGARVAWRLRGGEPDLLAAVGLIGGLALLPISMTSDVWGDLGVTFLLWWTAGYLSTRSGRPAPAAVSEAARPAPSRDPGARPR